MSYVTFQKSVTNLTYRGKLALTLEIVIFMFGKTVVFNQESVSET